MGHLLDDKKPFLVKIIVLISALISLEMAEFEVYRGGIPLCSTFKTYLLLAA